MGKIYHIEAVTVEECKPFWSTPVRVYPDKNQDKYFEFDVKNMKSHSEVDENGEDVIVFLFEGELI